MAITSVTKLVTSFTGANGKNVNYTFNDSLPAEDIDVSDVNALMTAMVTNKALFEKQPSVIKGASVVNTITTDLDLSAAS